MEQSKSETQEKMKLTAEDYKKRYREKHAELFNIVVCACGCKYQLRNKQNHIRTRIHQLYELYIGDELRKNQNQ